MKKPASPEQYTHLISEIEAACSGTAWEAEFRRGWDKDSIRFQISLTAEARSQQFENRGAHVYAPAIYFDDDLEGETTWGFRIQTTSFGALPASEIEKFSASYMSATALVRRLTAIFEAHCEA